MSNPVTRLIHTMTTGLVCFMITTVFMRACDPVEAVDVHRQVGVAGPHGA